MPALDATILNSMKIIILNNDSFLSIWQEAIYNTTIPAGNFVPENIDELFNDIPNVFGIANDILDAGFDADSRDHSKRLE